MVLLRVAAGLRKRKRREWIGAVVITVVMTAAHLFRAEQRPLEASITLVLLVALLAARSQFTARPDPRSRWFAARIFVQLTAVAIAFGLLLLYAYPHHVPDNPSFWQRLREVVQSMIGAGGTIPLSGERYADIFHGTLLAFGMVTVVATVLLVLRPSQPIARLSDEDEHRLRALLDRHGDRDSLGYFALRRDKSVVWSPSGKAAITYRVVHGVALASGDPIGDPEAWPGAIAEYRSLVEQFAWTPAVMGCSELGATVFKREYKLSALALGDEAIVDVDEFSLDGRAMRGVRQACTRVARAGYDVRVRRVRDLAPDELAELHAAAAAWRGDAVERGFSMALSRLGIRPTVTASWRRRRARARCTGCCTSCRGVGRALARSHAPRSHVRQRTQRIHDQLTDHGVPGSRRARVSLNFAVFRDAIERGERIGAGPILRMWRSLLIFASRWWQIESLYRFNVKFRPYWEPRFISFPAARDLPRIAVAALEAEAFIVRPRRLQRWLGRG